MTVSEQGERWHHEYGLLELCQRIHGSITGSGDPITDGEARRLCEWLEWRCNEGWEINPHGRSGYDNGVRSLCLTAAGELREDVLSRDSEASSRAALAAAIRFGGTS